MKINLYGLVALVFLLLLCLIIPLFPTPKKYLSKNNKNTIAKKSLKDFEIPSIDPNKTYNVLRYKIETNNNQTVTLRYKKSYIWEELTKTKKSKEYKITIAYPLISNDDIIDNKNQLRYIYTGIHGNSKVFCKKFAHSLYQKIKNEKNEGSNLTVHFTFDSSLDPWEPSMSTKIHSFPKKITRITMSAKGIIEVEESSN